MKFYFYGFLIHRWRDGLIGFKIVYMLHLSHFLLLIIFIMIHSLVIMTHYDSWVLIYDSSWFSTCKFSVFSRFMMIHLMWVIMMTHSVLMSIIWYMVWGWKLFLWCTWDDWVTSGRSHTISGWIHLLGNCLKLHWTEVKANKILISEHDVILFANPFFACHVFPPLSLVVCWAGEINQKHHFLTSLYVFDNSYDTY